MGHRSVHPYLELRHFSFSIGNKPVEVISKPGIPAWDELLPSTSLLAEYPLIRPSDRVLLFGCHHGALSVVLARRLSAGSLWIQEKDTIALELTRKTLELNHIDYGPILANPGSLELDHNNIDVVYMQLPKGRQLSRRWLLQAYQALDVGGNLYLAGSNNSGIQSAIKDASDLFGDSRILGYKKGNRIAQLIKRATVIPLPAWASEPGVAPHTWIEYSIQQSDHEYFIRSLPGVFSYDHLDPGTEFLINAISIRPGARVLDVGCGYGIIGMVATKRGASWVDMVDNDLYAIASCQETLALNRITNATVLAGDLLEPFRDQRYDLILSNPPFHAGLGIDYQISAAMFVQSYQALNPGGQIVIVANRFIPYHRLIEGTFGNVSTLTETGKFRLLSAIK